MIDKSYEIKNRNIFSTFGTFEIVAVEKHPSEHFNKIFNFHLSTVRFQKTVTIVKWVHITAITGLSKKLPLDCTRIEITLVISNLRLVMKKYRPISVFWRH